MAKRYGNVARIYAGGYDLSGSTSSVDADSAVEAADVTTFGATAKGFIPGQQTGKIKQKTFYDDTPGAIEPMVAAFRGTPGAVATFWPGGDAAGQPGYGSAIAEMLDTATIASPVGGATTLEADWSVSGGLEDVVSLLPQTAETGTGAAAFGASSDFGAATTAGAAAYFHLTAVDAATTVSGLKVQHSSDNTTFVDLLTSGLAGTATGADRQATAATATVNRYTRAAWTITSAKHATLAVAIHRG